MNRTHDWQDTAVASIQDRPETPPPPYNVEDSDPYSTSTLHNPEVAELEAGIPYQVRGLISPTVRRSLPTDVN